MLVIFSDLHITDESTAINVAPEAFDILLEEIKDNAINKKAEEVRIIMLGDIFDLVRTDHWLKLPKEERPWNGDLDENTGMNSNILVEQHYNEILSNILSTESGKSFIKMLNSIKSNLIKVPVIITYVVGNHDRAFNNFVSLQSILSENLKNIDKIEYVNSYLGIDYATLCKHGNEYDENNYGFDLYNVLLKESGKDKNNDRFNQNLYKVITIGEVVTCELMSGLIYRVNNELKDPVFTKLLMDVNNVRPMLNVFTWLYWYGNKLSPEKKKCIINAFRDSLKAVIETDLSKKWTKIANVSWLYKRDLVDNFEILLDLIEDKEFDEVSKYLEIAKIKDKIWHEKDECLEGAKLEINEEKNKAIQYVFFGHTHLSRTDYLKGNTDGIAKIYINTGTYLPYITQTEDNDGFANAFQMTMAFVYSKSEDTNGKQDKQIPSLDVWNGIKRKIYS